MSDSKKIRLNAGRMMALRLADHCLRTARGENAIWNEVEIKDASGAEKRIITIHGKYRFGATHIYSYNAVFVMNLDKTAVGWRARSAQLTSCADGGQEPQKNHFQLNGVCE